MTADPPAPRYIIVYERDGSYRIVDTFTNQQLMRTYDAKSADHYRSVAEDGRDLEQERIEALNRASGRKA
jgi:hypothetical protein